MSDPTLLIIGVFTAAFLGALFAFALYGWLAHCRIWKDHHREWDE